MRLINCQVENVRVHSDLSVDFSPRITLIGGANETGKSTLIEALHRTLFLKATATGAPIEALRSKLHLGHPTVQIKFEAKGESYILRKCFTGPSGQVTLLSETNGKQLSGPAAEECLAGLLGVKESLGSRQVSTLLPTRWAHLWVMQGSAGNDLLKRDKSYYDFDSLLVQLEKKGGAAIQQSAHDQRVVQRIENAIDENFTSRGPRKNSAFWQRQEEFENAELALEMTLSKLQEYEQSSAELVEITDKIEHLQNIALPKLLEQKRVISSGADARKQLEGGISLAEKELEPIQLRYDTLQKDLLTINQLQEEIRTKEEARATLQKKQSEQKASELVLVNALQTKQEVHTNLKRNLQRMDQRRNLLQLLVEQFRIREVVSSLKLDLEKAEKNLERRKELEQKIAALSKIGRSELQQLQGLNQKLRDARTRQEAMATGIKVLRSNQVIRLNGEELRPGEQKQLSETFQLQVGDDVSLEIRPGGSDALNDLQSQYLNQQKEYSATLSRLGLESIQAAEKDFEQRVTLELQLSSLEESTQEHIQIKQKELETCELKALDLAKQLVVFDQCLEELAQEKPLPTSAAGLGDLQQQIRRTFADTSKAFDQAQSELELTQLNLQQFKNAQVDDESNSKVMDSQLSTLRQNLSTVEKEHVDHELLKTQINSLKSQLQNSAGHLATLKSQLASLEEVDSSNELLKIEAEIQSLEKEKETLIADKGAAKRTCDNISSSNPYEAVEQAQVQLEIAKADYQTLKRLTDSHKLLQELFSNAQADLSTRYTEPLAQSIGSFLKPLISGGPVAQLSFDQASGFSGLQMRRGKEFYDFDQLSGGMREQLTTALRLSMADVLKSEHDGCLPLVFDDAFTNSDPERVQVVKQMLQSAVDKGLQIILLTCDPEAYEKFADQHVLLGQ